MTDFCQKPPASPKLYRNNLKFLSIPSQNLTARRQWTKKWTPETISSLSQIMTLKKWYRFWTLFSDSGINLRPPGISDLIMAGDKIQSINVIGVKVHQTPTPRSSSTEQQNNKPRDQTLFFWKNLRKKPDRIISSRLNIQEQGYSLRNYCMWWNWPEELTCLEVDVEYAGNGSHSFKMDDLYFVKRKVPYDLKTEYGINGLGELRMVLDHSSQKVLPMISY